MLCCIHCDHITFGKVMPDIIIEVKRKVVSQKFALQTLLKGLFLLMKMLTRAQAWYPNRGRN